MIPNHGLKKKKKKKREIERIGRSSWGNWKYMPSEVCRRSRFCSRPMGGLNLAVPMLQRRPIASTRPHTGGGFSFSYSPLLFFFTFFQLDSVYTLVPGGLQKPKLVRGDHHSTTGSLTVQTVLSLSLFHYFFSKWVRWQSLERKKGNKSRQNYFFLFKLSFFIDF